jgi:hypothetical protein
MAGEKRHCPEQAVEIMRRIEAGVANGKTFAVSCMEAQISKATYTRWYKKYHGVEDVHALRLKQLAQENANLKRLVAELSLQKLVLRDIIATGGLSMADNKKSSHNGN